MNVAVSCFACPTVSPSRPLSLSLFPSLSVFLSLYVILSVRASDGRGGWYCDGEFGAAVLSGGAAAGGPMLLRFSNRHGDRAPG